ncbi:MAG: hypothetical protein H0V09_04845 [Gemmatimonadetes bacterium]|nr:hypothetical protein [Gemmatimonadota bacterium]
MIVLALVFLVGMVVHDHALPRMRSAGTDPEASPASIAHRADAGRAGQGALRVAGALSPALRASLPRRHGPHRSPLLSGRAARIALDQARREALMRNVQEPVFPQGRGPAL